MVPSMSTTHTQESQQIETLDREEEDVVLAQTLVEEISIDGMCGVY